MAETENEKWSEFLQTLVEMLDVESYLKDKGFQFTGSVSSSGWAECKAIDRPDDHPSAAVHVNSGYYKDLGGGPSFPFFQLLVHLGIFSSFRLAVESVAGELKMKSKMPKSRKGESFWSRLKFKRWNPVAVRGMLKELGLQEETLMSLGATMAITPAPSSENVVALPVFCPSELFDVDVKGFVLRNAGGGTVRHYRGKGAPVDHLKNKSVGSGGMINRQAFENWENVEYVIKVEGITDLLSGFELVPPEERKRYAIITNSDGCDAGQTPLRFSHHMRGKKVVIIHDGDEPGQFGDSKEKQGGAVRWVNAALAGGCEWATNLQLYETIEPKKGPDFRDWINTGGTWAQLLQLIDQSPKQRPESLNPENNELLLEPHQQILNELDIAVLGHRPDGSVDVFNIRSGRLYTIERVSALHSLEMFIRFGEQSHKKIHRGSDECPPGFYLPHEVLEAIAIEASKREISKNNTIGVGFHVIDGAILSAVGCGEWIEYCDGRLIAHTQPTIGDETIVRFGSAGEEWYDRELLEQFIPAARSPQWRQDHFSELVDILQRWGNHQHPIAETLLASLMLCSWVQNIWNLRPWIGIQGESSSGKSVLMNFMADYFGNLSIGASNTSEAGVRAALRGNGKIILLDEFEAGRERDKIIATLMGASRSGGASGNLRATQGQQTVTGDLCLIPWLSAVELKADKQTERNRYLMFDLANRSSLPWFECPKAGRDDEQLRQLRNKSIACVFVVWQRALELADRLAKTMDGEYSRVGESYSTVCAMHSAVQGHSDTDAVRFFTHLLAAVSPEVEESEESHQERILAAILKSQVQKDGGERRSVFELLKEQSCSEAVLNRYGIFRYTTSEAMKLKGWQNTEDALEESHIFIDTSDNGLVRRQLLRGTDHARENLGAVLVRLQGAFRIRRNTGRGVVVPVSVAGGSIRDVQEFAVADTSDFLEL